MLFRQTNTRAALVSDCRKVAKKGTATTTLTTENYIVKLLSGAKTPTKTALCHPCCAIPREYTGRKDGRTVHTHAPALSSTVPSRRLLTPPVFRSGLGQTRLNTFRVREPQAKEVEKNQPTGQPGLLPFLRTRYDHTSKLNSLPTVPYSSQNFSRKQRPVDTAQTGLCNL